jgi:hypothetical protein
MPLSEKARGKQRAVDPEPEPEPEPDAPRQLLVRFTEGLPDLTVTVGKLDSARDVKSHIRQARPELLNRRLRLIHSGRLLTNDTLLYPLLEGPQTEIEDNNIASSTNAAKPATTWFHCSIGQAITPDDPEEDDRPQTTQIQPIRGFDRLASVGFSRQDIENLRQHFHNLSSSNYLDHNFTGDEDSDEHVRALEDQWIDSMTDAQSAPALLSSSFLDNSVLQGLLIGFFCPFLPFLMAEERPAVFWGDGSHNHTQNVLFLPSVKTGLLVGFLANVLFGMWRYLLDSS